MPLHYTFTRHIFLRARFVFVPSMAYPSTAVEITSLFSKKFHDRSKTDATTRANVYESRSRLRCSRVHGHRPRSAACKRFSRGNERLSLSIKRPDKRLRFRGSKNRNDKSMRHACIYIYIYIYICICIRSTGIALVRDKGAHSLSIKMVACDVDAGRAIISKNAIIVRARLGP